MPFEKNKYFEKDKLKVHVSIYEGIPLIVVVGEADANTIGALKAAFDYAMENKTTQLIVGIRAMVLLHNITTIRDDAALSNPTG